MNLSEVHLFVALGALLGFAGGLLAIGGALIAIPLLTAGFGGNGNGDGFCQRKRDLVYLRTKEALACPRWPHHDRVQHRTGARVLPNGALRLAALW